MDIMRLREILGPVRLYYSPKNEAWLLDQHPATGMEIIKAAEIVLASKSPKRPNIFREIQTEPKPISDVNGGVKSYQRAA